MRVSTLDCNYFGCLFVNLCLISHRLRRDKIHHTTLDKGYLHQSKTLVEDHSFCEFERTFLGRQLPHFHHWTLILAKAQRLLLDRLLLMGSIRAG